MKKIQISFKEREVFLYDHLKTKRNISDYIKDLIESDLSKNSKGDK